MNICITNHDMQPQFMGGIKRVISILAKEWERECNVTIVSVAPQGTEYDIFGKVSQYILPNSDNILSAENEDYFSNIINTKKIDIILHPYAQEKNFTQLCIEIKKRWDVKLITALHFSVMNNSKTLRSYFFNRYRLDNSVIAWIKEIALYIKFQLYTKHKVRREEISLINNLIANSDKLVFLSKSHIDCLTKRISDRELQKITAINNPKPYGECNKCTSAKKKQILWCGRAEYSIKRIDRIIDIWREIAPEFLEWELIIIGSGNIEHFKDLTKRLQIPNITFTGSCDPTKYYEQGAILCMTSSTEGLPMVLIEAMQYGCATIAYNSFESLQDIITDGYNGFAVTPFKKKEYINILRTLMTDKALREKFGQNGMEMVKRFDRKIIAKQWIELFRKVLRQKE